MPFIKQNLKCSPPDHGLVTLQELKPSGPPKALIQNLTRKQFQNSGLHSVLSALISFHGEADVLSALVGLLLPLSFVFFLFNYALGHSKIINWFLTQISLQVSSTDWSLCLWFKHRMCLFSFSTQNHIWQSAKFWWSATLFGTWLPYSALHKLQLL